MGMTCLCVYVPMRGNIGARNRLTAAKSLFDEGLIDESDFKKAKADLISTVIASD